LSKYSEVKYFVLLGMENMRGKLMNRKEKTKMKAKKGITRRNRKKNTPQFPHISFLLFCFIFVISFFTFISYFFNLNRRNFIKADVLLSNEKIIYLHASNI